MLVEIMYNFDNIFIKIISIIEAQLKLYKNKLTNRDVFIYDIDKVLIAGFLK